MTDTETTQEQLHQELHQARRRIAELETIKGERERVEALQSILLQIAQAANAPGSLKDLIEVIHRQIGTLIDATNFYVALFDPDLGLYTFPYWVDEQDDDFVPQPMRNSFTDYVRRTGQPILIDELVFQRLAKSGEIVPFGPQSPIWLGAPLRTPTGVIGVVAVQSYHARSLYSDQDLELLAVASEHIAAIIDRKRREEALRQHNLVLETLSELSREVASTLKVGPILDTVVRAIGQMIDVTSVYVCDWDAAQKTSTVLAEFYGPEASPQEQVSDLSITYGPGTQPGSRFQIPADLRTIHYDTVDLPPSARNLLARFDGKSLLIIPLKAEEIPLGTIELWDSRRKRSFTREEIDLVQAVARQVSITINNAKLHEALLESEDRYRTLFENVPIGISLSVLEGEVFMINEAMRRMIGYSQTELDELDGWSAYRDPGDRSRMIEQLERDGYVRDFEVTLQHKDGSPYAASMTIIPFQAMGENMIMTMLVDLSAHKQAAQRELELAVERERMDILAKFITHASHEFRTPLSNINTSAHLLDRLAEPEDRKRHTHLIREQVNSITELVEALATMTKLDSSHQLTLTDVDLNEIVQAVVGTMGQACQDKGVELVAELSQKPLLLSGHLRHLTQAFKHLGDNALRYTDAGGTIIFRSRCANDQAVIEIIDTGCGICEEDLIHIFDRFYRADSARTTRGFGLGLPTAKAIVNMHQGDIEVISDVGVGSTFNVVLPLKC